MSQYRLCQLIILCTSLVLGTLASLYFFSGNTDNPSNHTLLSGDEKVDLFDASDPRIRVLYFGYTRCPDVCPTSLAILSAALKKLDVEQHQKISPFFITLDPKRDDNQTVSQYAMHFHPSITGLTGTESQIKALADNYGVLYQTSSMPESAIEYTVDHSSFFYFVSSEGKLIEKVPHTLNYEMIIDAIARLTAKS